MSRPLKSKFHSLTGAIPAGLSKWNKSQVVLETCSVISEQSPKKSLSGPASSDVDSEKLTDTPVNSEPPSPVGELTVTSTDEELLLESIKEVIRLLEITLDPHPLEYKNIEGTGIEKKIKASLAILRHIKSAMSMTVASFEKAFLTTTVAKKDEEDEDESKWLSREYDLMRMKKALHSALAKDSKSTTKKSGSRGAGRHSSVYVEPILESKGDILPLEQIKATATPSSVPKAPSKKVLKRKKTTRSLSEASVVYVDTRFKENPHLAGALLKADRWDFDVFHFADLCDSKPLTTFMLYIFETCGFSSTFGISQEVLITYFDAIESNYFSVAYHNSIHATDVVQTMHFYFQSQAFSKLFSPEEKMAVLVASAVHDVSHPGNNNNFEVEAETDIAITYNDQSVLENFHLATAFRILKQTGHNIFGHLPKKTQRMLRDLMIHAVLATDMKLHVRLVALLQSMVQKKKAQGTWFDASKVSEERKELLGIAIHTADISSASKRLPIALEWAHRIHDEFWNQGDQERSLDIPVVPVMDRNKPNFAKSQMAFISFIVDPLYDVFVQVVPESQVCLRQQKSNYGYWQARIDVGQAIKNRLREDQE